MRPQPPEEPDQFDGSLLVESAARGGLLSADFARDCVQSARAQSMTRPGERAEKTCDVGQAQRRAAAQLVSCAAENPAQIQRWSTETRALGRRIATQQPGIEQRVGHGDGCVGCELFDGGRATVCVIPVQCERRERTRFGRADAEVSIALQIQQDRAGEQRTNSNVRRNPVFVHREGGCVPGTHPQRSLRTAADRRQSGCR